MSFGGIAAMISGKRPFYLYEFSRGSTLWFFCSMNKDWTTIPDMFDLVDVFAEPNVFERVWIKSPIKHGRIPHTSKSHRSDFPITLPISDFFAQSFLSPIGLDPTKITIRKGFENDPDLELNVVYRGRVVQAVPSDKDGTIKLICGTNLSNLDRKALPAVMQKPCRHVVYNPNGGCGLKLSDWQLPMVASAMVNLNVTVALAAGYPDNFFRGGIIELNGVIEAIAAHVGTTITLSANSLPIAAEIISNGSAEIKLARGCDLSFLTCRDAFSNEDNHGGFPHIGKNPFDGGSIA